MKKIIGIDRPFDLVKQFIVYEDGNKIETYPSTVDTRIKDLFALIKKYDVQQIDLVGPKKYLLGIKEQIEEENISKYNFKNLEINII